ncbi:vitamin B12 ABC transporter permease BtuC [Vibrio agarivorans]|uniref:Vitamin B12 ABC transporter permease BtuC n=1 Tax=Vibrio agarivorans TaxID=153622 RepID=A0ABT7XZ52_9VIBR|nr:vitamin B12 ABC transporter permease BtuC [Vibrio agarivorans]MDN2481063.1 vitamin B12 ABC transporter permease BtuC [Vibrio agarivorans]
MDLNQIIATERVRWRRAFFIFASLLTAISAFYLALGELTIFPFWQLSDIEQQLLLQLRMPRLVSALTIGASLAVAGAILQTLLANPLAEPGIIGISGGSSLGMVVVMFGLPWFATPLGFMVGAFLGALLFTLLLVFVASKLKLNTSRLLLVGVALGILSSAVVTWAFYFSDDMNLRQLLYWLMGNLAGNQWYQLFIVVLVLPVLVWLTSQASNLDKLMLGESHAKQLGLDITKMRRLMIICAALLVGSSVALGGVIGFVGLIVPHLIRLKFGYDHRYLLPLSAMAGAGLVALADLVARMSLSSGELPVGVVTTTIGAPIFIWMLVKNHDYR